jgi:hypothetical protein
MLRASMRFGRFDKSLLGRIIRAESLLINPLRTTNHTGFSAQLATANSAGLPANHNLLSILEKSTTLPRARTPRPPAARFTVNNAAARVAMSSPWPQAAQATLDGCADPSGNASLRSV